jgi:hypothetical protein
MQPEGFFFPQGIHSVVKVLGHTLKALGIMLEK